MKFGCVEPVDEYLVTPHAGVRIEISRGRGKFTRRLSPPTRGCELKYKPTKIIAKSEVTPHAGVRIEMICGICFRLYSRSPPTRGCELKWYN